MSTKVIAFIGLDLISNVQPVDFVKILPVPVPKSIEFVIGLTFLWLEASISVLADLLLVLDSLNVDVAIGDQSPLPVQLRVKLGILALAVVIDGALLVHLGSQCLDEADVGIYTRLVIFIHASLFLVQPPKVLLHIH